MKRLPIGSRIRFTKTLQDDGELGRVFATEGETGMIVAYDCKEGYDVRTDSNPSLFGATRREFERIE